jgi:hypothetical protein
VIALVISALVAAYLLIPNALFRFILGLFVPLRAFQERKTEDLTRAVVTLVTVFLVALFAVWHIPIVESHPLNFPDTIQLRSSDYRIVFSGLYSESSFKDSGTKFWDALSRTVDRQIRFAWWYYLMVGLWAGFSGWLSTNYYRFSRNRWYSRFADFYLFPHISQWYVLLSPFIFGPGTLVKTDVLMSDDTLYRGDIAEHFLDREGNLSGLFLTNPTRFDRRKYLKDIDAWGIARPKAFYWHPIPSAKLYLVGDKILNLNLNYSSPTAIKEEVEKYVSRELKGQPISVSVNLSKPESVEEHPHGGLIIEIEFYESPEGRYRVWPYLKKVRPNSESKAHFTIDGEFASKEAARAAAIKTGTEKIQAGFGESI